MKRTKAISLPSAKSFRNAEQQENLDLPERVLWAEVLREALFDLRRKEQDRRHGDAARWLASDEQYIGSFRFCCDVVGLAPRSA